MTIRTLALSAALSLAVALPSSAETFTKGVVKKLDTDRGKVTIIHEELVELEMPAMTMVFEVADQAMLDTLAAGQEIEFTVERLNGKLTVTAIR